MATVKYKEPLTGTDIDFGAGPTNTGTQRIVVGGANLSTDAFNRLRVSVPEYVFDAQMTNGLQPLVFDQLVTGSGASIAHDMTNRCALLTFASTPSGRAIMQSFEYFRYQPGRSQLIFVTFNLTEAVPNCLKFAGYSDGTNGIELQQDGTTVQLALLSDTDNGDQIVPQSSWNLDKLNGSGASGLTLDLTKTQILVIELQALYVGRVRVGFDIDGDIVWVHQFTHANRVVAPYIQTANLPIRCGMTSTAAVSTTMRYICSSVISESGDGDIGGYHFSQEFVGVAENGTRSIIGSIRPKSLFLGHDNRTKIVLESIEVIATGNFPIKWEACIGQALSGAAFTDVNSSYSAVEYDITGAMSGSPTVIIDSGYVAASASTKVAGGKRIIARYPFTLDSAGSPRDNGTITFAATGLGGTTSWRLIANWIEIQ